MQISTNQLSVEEAIKYAMDKARKTRDTNVYVILDGDLYTVRYSVTMEDKERFILNDDDDTTFTSNSAYDISAEEDLIEYVKDNFSRVAFISAPETISLMDTITDVRTKVDECAKTNSTICIKIQNVPFFIKVSDGRVISMDNWYEETSNSRTEYNTVDDFILSIFEWIYDDEAYMYDEEEITYTPEQLNTLLNDAPF